MKINEKTVKKLDKNTPYLVTSNFKNLDENCFFVNEFLIYDVLDGKEGGFVRTIWNFGEMKISHNGEDGVSVENRSIRNFNFPTSLYWRYDGIGNNLCVGYEYGDLVLMDLMNDRREKLERIHMSRIQSMDVLDGMLLTGADDAFVLWNLEKNRFTQRLVMEPSSYNNMLKFICDDTVICSSWDSVKVLRCSRIDRTNGGYERVVEFGGNINCMEVDKRSRLIITSSDDCIRTYSLRDGVDCNFEPEFLEEKRLNSSLYFETEKILAFGDCNGRIYAFDLRNLNKELYEKRHFRFKVHTMIQNNSSDINKNSFFANSTFGGNLKCLDVHDGTELFGFEVEGDDSKRKMTIVNNICARKRKNSSRFEVI